MSLKKHFYTQRMRTIPQKLKDEKSVTELMKTVDIFSIFSGLKPNKSKCEVAGLGALKGVKIALCGMECTDLMFNQSIFWNSITHLNKNFENQENFINLVLKIKKLKSLAISKTVLLALGKGNSKFSYS